MAFQPVGNAAEVIIRGEADLCEVVTTLGYLGVVNWGLPTLQTLVEAVATVWQDEFLPNLPDDYQVFEVVGTGLRSATDFTHTVAFGGGLQGTLGGDVHPNNVSLAVKFSTGLAGRSNRGRNFWPLFLKSETIGNVVTNAKVFAMTQAYLALKAETEVGGNWLWSVISRFSNNEPRAVGVATPITGVSVTDTTVDSMRRRLPGRGR